jgi:two-component system, NarL family, nitrate/nitrite response regulator NarL
LSADRSQLEPVRLVILSSDPLVAAGLGHLVEEGGDAVIVSDAADAEVALIDAGRGGDLDGGRGLEALADLAVPAVVLVDEEEDAAAALAAGARGALLRTSDPGSLWAALVAVRAGLTVLDGGFAPAALAGDPPGAPPGLGPARSAGGSELTAREREVLALLSRGLSNKQIAQRLAISDHTAKFHVNGILGKLGAATRTEAVVIAARQGLVAL